MPRGDSELDPSLQDKAVRGILWSGLNNWGEPIISLAAFLVVVRTIGPEAYGLFGMALLVVGLGELLVSNTLTDSLVQGRDLSSSHSDSVFWAILAFGIALTIGVVLLSGPIGAIFDDTRVSDLSSWLALLILLSAGSATQSALLHRNLQFRALSLVSLISVAIAGIAGVASALAGWGAWSLVVQLLVLKVVALLLLWRACEWRPRRSFSVQRLREVFGFGIGTLGLRLTKYAYDGSPRLFIGVVIGPAALGFYQAALRIYRICRTALVSPVSQVAMPVAARVQGDSALLARATEEATRFVAMVGIPCFIGLSLTAPEVLPLVFGDRWGEIGDDAAFSRETVIQVAQLVPLTGIATCTSTIGMSVLRGIGRSGWRLLLAIAQLSTALILLALIGRYGLNYVAIAMVATVYLQWPVKLFVMRNVAEIPIMPQLRALLTPLVASLAMAMAVTIWRQAVSESIGMVGLLASEILVGAVTYASVLAIIAREDLSRIIEVFRADVPHETWHRESLVSLRRASSQSPFRDDSDPQHRTRTSGSGCPRAGALWAAVEECGGMPGELRAATLRRAGAASLHVACGRDVRIAAPFRGRARPHGRSSRDHRSWRVGRCDDSSTAIAAESPNPPGVRGPPTRIRRAGRGDEWANLAARRPGAMAGPQDAA